MPPELPTETRARSRWKMPMAALVFIGATSFIGFTGIQCREQTLAGLRVKSAERSVPTVAVATPSVQKSVGVIELPGRLDAYSQAAIFARVSGYVANRKADIGTHVKAGDLLAEID
ncbi:MAG: efflux RND transporter periplasmic adaptor subunit, partial [Hyphomicrobium denitrificans]|nr:efflux RND transporter periplasmic adaptor subunit [Hyphomicrobium denitrificans]